MLMRSALIVCAAAMMAALSAPAHADATRCEETNFRVYFQHGSATLDQTALEAMDLAERNVGGCSYAALHVSLDRSSPYARQRASAIRTAAHGRAWNVVRVDARGVQRASFDAGGPEFAEVTMTPRALQPSTDNPNDAGV